MCEYHVSEGKVRVIHLCKMEVSDRSGHLFRTCHQNATRRAAAEVEDEVSLKHSVHFFFVCQFNVTRLSINYFIQLFASGQPEYTSGVRCQVLPHLPSSSCTAGFAEQLFINPSIIT